jgi:hypothetical protein
MNGSAKELVKSLTKSFIYQIYPGLSRINPVGLRQELFYPQGVPGTTVGTFRDPMVK